MPHFNPRLPLALAGLAAALASLGCPAGPPTWAPEGVPTGPAAGGTPAPWDRLVTPAPALPEASARPRPALDLAKLNMPAGFNFDMGVPQPVGYLTALAIGGRELAADLSVVAPDGRRAVVAVLSAVAWAGGPDDPITLTGQVSAANRDALQAVAPGAARVAWRAWDFDVAAGQPFKALTTDPAADVQPVDATLREAVRVEAAANTEVVAPPNYTATLVFAPAAKAQALTTATGAAAKTTKPWGR